MSEQEFQSLVLQRLDSIEQNIDARLEKVEARLEKVETRIDHLETNLKDLETNLDKFNDRFSNYQQAVQWVVQLAFTLIGSATITIIISSVLRR